MAGTIHHHSLNSFYSAVALDPKSLILSQFSNLDQPPRLLQLTTQSFYMERGSRYKDYAALRESKLRMKSMKQPILEEDVEEEEEVEMILTPPQKHVKFQGTFAAAASKRPKAPRPSSSSVLTQSVPDFSSALRKENRKPPALPPMMEKSLTPPPLKSRSGKFDGMAVGKLGGPGSRSVNSGEKRSGGGLMTRKSYANVEDLRGLASDARTAINAENRGGGKIARGVGKRVLSCTQY